MLKLLNINLSEWRLVWVVSVIFLALAAALLWYGYAHMPDGFVYIGTQYINTGDTAVYYSWIEQVRDGHWLQWNLYTPEDHPRFLLDVFWLAVGWLTSALSISAIAGYHLARFLLIPVVVATVYMTVAYFFREPNNRRLAFLLVIFGAGLGGWYQIAVGLQLIPTLSGFLPMDLWVSEGFTFLTLYHSPHFMASLVLMLFTTLFFLMGLDTGNWRYSLAAGVTGFLLFEFHPYHAPTIFALLIAYGLVTVYQQRKVPWDMVRRGLVLGLFTIPAVAYHVWTLQEFSVRQQHAAQNATTTPGITMTLLSYGFLLVFAIVGFVAIWKKQRKSPAETFLATWAFVHALLIYAPVNYQRRLTEGLQVAMAMLAAYGLLFLREQFQSRAWWKYVQVGPELLTPLFIVCFGFTSVYFVNSEYHFIKNGGPYFAEDTLEAFQWMRDHTPEGSVIFSSYATGNLQPAFGVRHSYIGHWGMTANFTAKQSDVLWVFSKTPTQGSRAEFLRKRGVDYVYYGVEEIRMAGIHPEQFGLPIVFQNNSGYIYEVPEAPSETDQ